jgi:hypothetical protein
LKNHVFVWKVNASAENAKSQGTLEEKEKA